MKRCATGLNVCFLSFGGSVRGVNQQRRLYEPNSGRSKGNLSDFESGMVVGARQAG